MFVIRRIQCKGLYRQYSSTLAESFYNEEQWELQKVTKKLIDNEINPFVDQWEDAKMFPAKEVFKKFGSAGLLGINKPTEYGGLGLDYKYQLAFLEACGYIRSGGVASNTDNFNKKHVLSLNYVFPVGLGVQTDCSTPALSRFGSDFLKKEFLQPALTGS